MEDRVTRALYGTRAGRLLVKALLKLKFPKVMAAYLRSPLSRRIVPLYIKKHGISMAEYPKERYRSFAEFFVRKKSLSTADPEPYHLVSPCDGWLSAYGVTADSSFAIKGSSYRLCDLIDDEELAEEYCGGLCLIFRLTASDYHRYAFIDDGYIGESHYIEGKLHSVQPIACKAFPVYRLNRRCWNLLYTEHFGPVVQVEVGAMAVGGIVNSCEESAFWKGEEMGRFELCGSTIVLFIRRNRVQLLPDITAELAAGREYRVTQGLWIGEKT